jgi:hypothetical protein
MRSFSMAAIVISLKAGHRHSIPDDIIDVHGKTLGAYGYAVYGYLCRRINWKTGECYPSINRIAETFDMARSTVKEYLHKLHNLGLIKIEARQDPAGDPTSNQYTLLDPSPAAVKARVAELAAEEATGTPEGGRPPADPPPAEGVGCLPTHPGLSADPGGRSPADPEPDPDPLTTELNQAEGAVAGEETPKNRTGNPCSHPLEERLSPGDITICQHCWTIVQDTGAEEGQAHSATRAA